MVEAAARLADRVGYDRVTVARLAQELGVEPPSLYEHVEGREALARALRLNGLRALADTARRATVGRSGDDALVSLARELRRFVREHPGLYGATVRSSEGDPPETVRAAAELFEVFRALLQGYHLPPRELVHAMRYVRSALHGFVALELAGGFGLPESVDASYDRLVRTLADGLAGWSRPKSRPRPRGSRAAGRPLRSTRPRGLSSLPWGDGGISG